MHVAEGAPPTHSGTTKPRYNLLHGLALLIIAVTSAVCQAQHVIITAVFCRVLVRPHLAARLQRWPNSLPSVSGNFLQGRAGAVAARGKQAPRAPPAHAYGAAPALFRSGAPYRRRRLEAKAAATPDRPYCSGCGHLCSSADFDEGRAKCRSCLAGPKWVTAGCAELAGPAGDHAAVPVHLQQSTLLAAEAYHKHVLQPPRAVVHQLPLAVLAVLGPRASPRAFCAVGLRRRAWPWRTRA